MELLALKTFCTVVDEGGIAAASRQLYTVQSNVTTRIQRLEEELETALFFRQGRGLTVTPAGRVLYDYAQQVLQLTRQAKTAVQQAGEASGELRIGSMESFAAVRLPVALRRLRQDWPRLRPGVETGTSAALVDAVLAHRLDCAFVGGEIEHPELVSHTVLTEKLVEVGGAQGSDQHTLITFRQGCAYRARAEAWVRQQKRCEVRTMELGTLEGILGCISTGLGVTLLPTSVVTAYSYADDLITREIDPQLSLMPTQLVYHRSSVGLASLNSLRYAFEGLAISA
ncbi:MAG: LysR family transcriptional regulator [Marinobacterium sp.]|nr:LysR family transcriptional regulator [Marinobacterium sp.]